MVLTTPMVLTYPHGIVMTCYWQGLMLKIWTRGIESVPLNHTHTRGLSVACMRDSFLLYVESVNLIFF